MVKRGRDGASALLSPKRENPAKLLPPAPKRRREPAVGGGATGKTTRPAEEGRTMSTEKTNRVAGDSLPPQVVVVAGDEPDQAHAEWDVRLAPATLPRWWQLWVGTGGGMVVDCEELLWGWFPFTDEDFSEAEKEKVGWLSICADEVEGQLGGVLYDDIWQLKHIHEIPNPL